MRTTVQFLILTLPLLLAACDEQQIQYSYQSPTPIAPVPDGVETAVATAPAMGAASRATATLPPRTEVRWAAPDYTEDVEPKVLQGILAQMPTRYTPSDKQMPMRLGTWMIPAANGGETGELVVYYFGAGQGGSVEDNVQRWLGQFRAPAGVETPLVRYEGGPVGNLTVTRATMEGTWSPPAMGPGAPAQPTREEYALDALIVEGGPDGALFFRFTGPIGLIRSEDKPIRRIATSLMIAK